MKGRMVSKNVADFTSRANAIKTSPDQGHPGGVRRRLKARHLSMIALGGTIGTGLFIGAGGALAKGGPVGVLLAYVSFPIKAVAATDATG